RLGIALDVHEHVVRLVDLLDLVGELPATPVLEAVHGALARRDDASVALDHLRHLLALVGMDDENDLVMPHALDLLLGWQPPVMRGGVARMSCRGRKGTRFYLKIVAQPTPPMPSSCLTLS